MDLPTPSCFGSLCSGVVDRGPPVGEWSLTVDVLKKDLSSQKTEGTFGELPEWCRVRGHTEGPLTCEGSCAILKVFTTTFK